MANTFEKEPNGENFVDSGVSKAEIKAISEIFTHYKATGKILTVSKAKALQRIRIKKKQNPRKTGKSKA